MEPNGVRGEGAGGRRTFRQSEQHARPGEKNFLSLERLQLCVHGMRDVERASSAGWKRFGWLRGDISGCRPRHKRFHQRRGGVERRGERRGPAGSARCRDPSRRSHVNAIERDRTEGI